MSNNLFTVWTHPHNTTNVKDESATNAVQTVVLPLHRPHFCIFAAKGRANDINWYTGTEAIKEFGDATFASTSKFYNNEQIFLTGAVFPNQGAFITRLIDPEAKKASTVLELQITKNVDVPQYRRDDEGAYIYDENGDLIPLVGPDGSQLTNPGVRVKWVSRKVNEDEDYDYLKKRTVEVGEETTEIFPIVSSEYDSAGDWGNNAGFKFYCNARDQDSDLVQSQNALLYTFAPVEKGYMSDTPSPLGTVYGAQYAQFVLKPGAYDVDTSRKVSSNDSIFRLYTEANSTTNLLPFNVHFFEEYIQEAAQLISDVESTVSLETSDPFMVNICAFVDTNNNPYRNVEVDTSSDSVSMTDVYVHYLAGGDDGDTSRDKFEELYRQFLAFEIMPEFQDYMHYPVTHIYDTGYGTVTKHAQLDAMATLPNLKVVTSPQIASRSLFTMDEAISAGTALRTRATLTPESELYGTQACRAEIMLQAGYLNDKNISNVIPLTYWILLKRCEIQNSTYLKGGFGPDPNNRVTEFREINFVPYSKQQKEICWSNSLNYCEYGRLDRRFFAGLQSVYKNKTSLLANIQFTDAIIYLKYIIDWAWADTASAELPISALSQVVTTKINGAAGEAFGSKYTLSECSFYQTEEEALLGTTYHVRTVLVGDSPNLIWNSDIIVRRSNLDADSAA